MFPISSTSRLNFGINNNFYQQQTTIVNSVYIKYLFHPLILKKKTIKFLK